MNEKFLKQVESKEFLAILTNKEGTIIWKTNKSPVSTMYKEFFSGKFSKEEPFILYTNQAGMAVGIMLNKLNIIQCHAIKISECGLILMQKSGIEFDYKERIPLVKSSKNENEVCPIEKFLSENDDLDTQWKFLEERFKDADEHFSACEWKPK